MAESVSRERSKHQKKQVEIISDGILFENSTETSKDAATRVELKRQINLLSCITLVVGTIVGSGIFISPKGVLQYSGSVGISLVVWAACGIISLAGSLCYSELGVFFCYSGGEYIYLKLIFGTTILGDLLAFMYLWTVFIITLPANGTIVALTFAQYTVAPFFPGCDPPIVVVKLTAGACIILVYFVNCVSVKASTRITDIFTFVKVAGLALIIGFGISELVKGETQHLQNSFENSEVSALNLSLAFYSGLFAFGGWNNLGFVTDELKKPKKNIPIALIVSMVLITGLYLFVNVAYLTAMSPEELLESDAVALTFGDRLFGIEWSWVMAVIVACSTFGALNGNSFAISRSVFVGAQNGHLPDIFSMIHIEYFSPMPTLLIEMFISLVMLVSDDIYSLVNYVSFAVWLFIALCVTGLVYLRWKQPEKERPFKVPLVLAISFLVVTYAILGLSIFAAPVETGIGIAIIATGIPVYIVGVKWKNKPKKFLKIWGSVTQFFQKILLVVPQEVIEDMEDNQSTSDKDPAL